jgi:DNA-binding CsgD family transcriptional regulator
MTTNPSTRARPASVNETPIRVTLRQLCGLGLPAPLLLPSLLPVLRELVPSSHAGFFFCDEAGNITNLYAERMLSPQHMASFHDRHSNRQFRQHYLQRVAAAQPVSRRSVQADESTSAYQREVLDVLGIAHFLYAIVRHRGQPLGQLSLYRGADDAPFTAHDEQALHSVLHYLGEALSVPSPQGLPSLQQHSIEEGLALLDAQGQELYADANWPRLVRLAQGNAIAPATAMMYRETLPRFVQTVMAAVLASPLAVHRVDTAWGQFAFRQHAMASTQGREGAVALLISRLAAEPLRLAQGAAAAGLSPQQREVAVLMAQGHSNAAIAAQMGISINTAGYHAKQVFARLGVHERSAIAQALGSAAAS